ncbi:AMP-binding protein [Svornostia abyssi]|uniref:AMP-binding protein n=1 Tax=Svornostia abyssi TaxID=2898438 RepID=A0ABY5PGX5_9ACTN|nr:AMP-binding protein [Parviterribacteraceae bacterium J379]
MTRRSTPGLHPAEIPFTAEDQTAIAIVDPRRALTYSEFGGEVLEMAAGLAARGVVRHRVVGTVLSDRIEVASVMFAAWQLGAAFSPLSPRLDPEEAGRRVAGLSPALVVVDDSSTELPAGPPQVHVERLAAPGGQPPRTELQLTDAALVAWPAGREHGSTAGVVHHAAAAALLWHAARPGAALATHVPSLSCAEDLLAHLCATLAVGGTVLIGGAGAQRPSRTQSEKSAHMPDAR